MYIKLNSANDKRCGYILGKVEVPDNCLETRLDNPNVRVMDIESEIKEISYRKIR